jgi:hypothetical protein
MRHECWTNQGSLWCSPWKSVCHDWTVTDGTHSCMQGSECILAVTASWLISVCGFCLCGIRRWNTHVWWFLGMKEVLNLLQWFWVWEAGPIPWPGRSYEFTLLDNVFSDYVTEQIYIWPFGILLMERHTEIEHVLRPAVFWDCTQYRVVIAFRYFWITNQSHLQGSRCPTRTCLDSRRLHILDVC